VTIDQYYKKDEMRPLALLLLALSLCLPALTAAQPFGYSIDSDGQTTADDLYRIDLSTGNATRIGPVQPAFGPKYQDVEGLAISPGGVLFGADDALDALIRIDLNTAQATLVGPLGTNGQGPGGNLDYGLAFTCDGRLWLSSDTVPRLWQVDTSTGAATAPRDLPVGMTGLAARGNTLYGLGIDGNLYRYSIELGIAQLVGPLGIPAFDDGGLDFDANGDLWAITEYTPSDPSQPSRIYRVDVLTGQATFVANTRAGFEGLAIASPACVERSDAQVVPGPALPMLFLLGLLCAGLGLRRLAG